MSSQILKAFKKCRKEKRPALLTYTVAGDNTKNKSLEIIEIQKEGKHDAQLISPATYLPDTTRSNKAVDSWGSWAAVDVDDHEFQGNLKNELYNRFGAFHYTCYSTASSTTDHPKFRLVFPLSSTIESIKIKHFWFSLNKELGEIGDGQTKDLSRMYYIPAAYANANNFIFFNHL